MLESHSRKSRLLLADSREEGVISDGIDDPTGQGTVGGVREEYLLSHNGKLVSAQLFVGVEFGNGHGAGAVGRG